MAVSIPREIENAGAKRTLLRRRGGDGGIRTPGRCCPSTDFEGRETDKTPYISAQVRIKYVPKACKKGLFSYLVICVRMTLQLHFSRPGTIWAPRAPFRTRRTHE